MVMDLMVDFPISVVAAPFAVRTFRPRFHPIGSRPGFDMRFARNPVHAADPLLTRRTRAGKVRNVSCKFVFRTMQAPMPADDSTLSAKSTVQSLAKGFRVLEAFTAERSEMSLAEVARAAEIDNGTAFRFLNTLVMLGYIEK